MTTPPTTLLRPALEAAMQVARSGEAADPVQPAPPTLRRYLNFARLPAPALDIARRVVDEDEEFRARVASATTAEQVGEAGWLWLTRPAGWEERLDAIRKRQQQLEHAAHEERVEREAQRRLAGAEDRARRAEVALAAKTREADEARDALASERALRRKAEAELAQISETIEELRAQRNAAVRQLKDVEAELAQRTADLRHARHEIRMREAELQQGASGASVQPVTEPSQAELSRLIADAAAGAERLSAALAAAAEALAGPGAVPGPGSPAPAGPARARSAARRTPLRPPPGTTDDSIEAAEHLLRTPGVLLLVDGYNISHAIWWDQPLGVQRDRLVDALAELHARTGVDVEVVFDGADNGRAVLAPPRSGVRVRFSPAGVEADDVIIDATASMPPSRPVVVASSDRRVRDGVRRHGANVLGARQLAGALRR